MFGDKKFGKKLLSDLVDVKSSKRIYANEYTNEGIPFYRSKEIRELGIGQKPSVELFISKKRYQEIKNTFDIPKVGYILIAAIGATIGYTWIVNTEKPFYYKDGNLVILSVKGAINSVFLNVIIKNKIIDIKNKDVAGSAQMTLTIEKLEKIEIEYPPIELQNKFANFVNECDKLKFAIKEAMNNAKKIFDGILKESLK